MPKSPIPEHKSCDNPATMKLNQLRNLLAIAEKGSVRAAARYLGMSQPQLTRTMQELESGLGAKLFERSARGIALTAIGLRFVARAQTIQSEVRRAQEEIAQMQGQKTGTLVVGMAIVPHIALLPYALKVFRARYPDVLVDIVDAVFPTIEAQLKNGLLDCYIGPAPTQPTGSDLLMEKLFDNTRVIVCRRGHPLSGARSLRELTGSEWISTSITYRVEDELGPLFASHGLPAPRIVLKAHSALTYIATLAYSDLLTMLPVQWADFDVTARALDTIKVVEPLPAPPIYIVRRGDLPLTVAAEYFCDMVRRAAANLVFARGG